MLSFFRTAAPDSSYATPRTPGQTTRRPGAGWVSDWSARSRDCYPEEAEPPRTLFPEDAWLLSAVSWVMVSSG
jgi:hypothetical protein